MGLIDRKAYEAATESSGEGGIRQLVPGAYVCTVQAVRTEGDTRSGHWDYRDKQYVKVVYDIAEGEFAGKYSEDYFVGFDGKPLEEKDFAHSFFLSWKNYGFLKRRVRAFDESNPGFDALAAIDGEKFDLLVGKKFGVVLDGTVDLNDRGYDRWRFDVGEVVPVSDVRSGSCREPKVTDNRKAAATSTDSDDLPFYL